MFFVEPLLLGADQLHRRKQLGAGAADATRRSLQRRLQPGKRQEREPWRYSVAQIAQKGVNRGKAGSAENSSQFGKFVFLQMKAGRYLVKMAGDVPGSGETIGCDTKIDSTGHERLVNVLELLQGVFGVQMFHHLVAV